MSKSKPRSIELFAGGGGTTLGFYHAGFEHVALVEWETKACDTLRINAPGRWPNADIWEGDVRDWLKATSAQDVGDIDVVAGGPPCQPFSLAGFHNGDLDPRNMLPAALDVVRKFQPKAVVFENVPGLLRPSFRPYFDYTAAQLREPTLTIKKGEDWRDHAKRLAMSRRGKRSPSYRVETPRIMNSADFGIPQARRRVIMVGIRDDLDLDWNWDDFTHTHSETSLTYDKWVEPIYWEQHGISQPGRPVSLTEEALHALKVAGRPETERWQTIRDMLCTPTRLPPPIDGQPHPTISNHTGIPGARSYPGHTGSDIDLPAKTIKAGVHGVCGGEAMIRFADGSLRYLTVRESARVQGFPDDYVFAGARSTAMRQIGNAVSVGLARQMGERLRRNILGT
jgi:DNA (cytosine-5)-methyltransferase 1